MLQEFILNDKNMVATTRKTHDRDRESQAGHLNIFQKRGQGKAGICPLLEQNEWKIDIYYQVCTGHLHTHIFTLAKHTYHLCTVMKVKELSWSHQAHTRQSPDSDQSLLDWKACAFCPKTGDSLNSQTWDRNNRRSQESQPTVFSKHGGRKRGMKQTWKAQ